uniref:Uncharacterized protein n=1 Tax=Oryza sativa subsp. japonica TaxID=39947 RepID=Q6EQM6_ORYSJ|nr:hypothetical protein [Oryza sativa Japonica Group]
MARRVVGGAEEGVGGAGYADESTDLSSSASTATSPRLRWAADTVEVVGEGAAHVGVEGVWRSPRWSSREGIDEPAAVSSSLDNPPSSFFCAAGGEGPPPTLSHRHRERSPCSSPTIVSCTAMSSVTCFSLPSAPAADRATQPQRPLAARR